MEEQSWDETRVMSFITNEVEEQLELDYKRAASLSKSNKNEITKDVSAMANSAGGIIVYGISEYSDLDRRHLPERIDPIDRTTISKEWLEHVIGNIQPKIHNLIIHPVQLSSGINDCVYVIEIPKGLTAHQASSKKFYKRYNFESVEMDYHEILDVMGRRNFPKIKVELKIEFYKHNFTNTHDAMGFRSSPKDEEYKKATLFVKGTNEGSTYAKYVNIILEIPSLLLELHSRDSGEYTKIVKQNTKRDIVSSEWKGTYNKHNYGPSWYSPILPSRSQTWEIELQKDSSEINLNNMTISYEVYADNSLSHKNTFVISDIEIVREEKDTRDKK